MTLPGGGLPPVRYLGGPPDLLQQQFPDRFADAEASFEAARFVLAGVPYDRTVSFRHGARAAPRWIRQASWNLETLNLRNRVSLRDVPVHDMGDLPVTDLPPEAMVEAVRSAARRIAQAGKFPLLLGGEHSTVPPVVEALKERYPGLAVLQLDAHLDYRREYEGTPHNHACAMRRVADAVGASKVAAIGIRSADAEELADAERDGFRFHTAYDVQRLGMGQVLQEALDRLDATHLYLTLDIDALDPAYAPGTGTPEPFGLTPWDVLKVATRTADRLVGFDVNEVSPAWDTGQTAALAAKLVREVVTEVREKQPHGIH